MEFAQVKQGRQRGIPNGFSQSRPKRLVYPVHRQIKEMINDEIIWKKK